MSFIKISIQSDHELLIPKCNLTFFLLSQKSVGLATEV